jgi:hypothetical protein
MNRPTVCDTKSKSIFIYFNQLSLFNYHFNQEIHYLHVCTVTIIYKFTITSNRALSSNVERKMPRRKNSEHENESLFRQDNLNY